MLIHDDCLEVNIDKVDCIITDPPYNVLPNIKKTFHNKEYKNEWDNFNDYNSFLEWTNKWFTKYYNILNDNGWMFIFWSQKYINDGIKIFNPDRILLWHYNNLVNGGNGIFAYDYDPIFVIKKGNPKLISGKHSCILNYTKPQSNYKKDKLLHPTQKPLELYKYLIKITNCNSYLDMFAGSGTLGVACEELNKDYILIEKEEEYIKIIKERLEGVK